MDYQSQFPRFANALAKLPNDFSNAPSLPMSLRIASDDRHEIYYAPFDHVTKTARIVLVGITPGRAQAIEALTTARQCLLSGCTETEAAAAAKVAASFSGPMRNNLISMLDHIGVHTRLGIASTTSLWSTDSHLVHFTSALRYPAFEEGKNFGGSGLLRSRLLTEQLETYFAAECRGLRSALFLPLGSAAQVACQFLVSRGALKDSQLLLGVPHSSGANAERIAYWLGRKPKHQLSSRTRADLLDSGREIALKRLGEWR